MPHGPQDPGVGAAAAHGTGESRPDLGIVGVGMPRKQGDSAHDHAGRAVAALERTGLEEGPLDGMQLTVAGQSFDRCDDMAGGVGHARPASPDRLAVEENGARAAFALATAGLGAGQAQLIAQREEQAPIRPGRELPCDAVDDDLPGASHSHTSRACAGNAQHTLGHDATPACRVHEPTRVQEVFSMRPHDPAMNARGS